MIYVDFENVPVTNDATVFNQKLQEELEYIAVPHKLPIQYNLNVSDLILDLKDKYQKPINIFVDNYDLLLFNDEFSLQLIKHESFSFSLNFTDKLEQTWTSGWFVNIRHIRQRTYPFYGFVADKRFLSVTGFNSEE